MSSHVQEDQIGTSVKIVSVFSAALSSLSRPFRKAINTAESEPKATVDTKKKDDAPVFTVDTKNTLQDKFTKFFKTDHSNHISYLSKSKDEITKLLKTPRLTAPKKEKAALTTKDKLAKVSALFADLSVSYNNNVQFDPATETLINDVFSKMFDEPEEVMSPAAHMFKFTEFNKSVSKIFGDIEAMSTQISKNYQTYADEAAKDIKSGIALRKIGGKLDVHLDNILTQYHLTDAYNHILTDLISALNISNKPIIDDGEIFVTSDYPEALVEMLEKHELNNVPLSTWADTILNTGTLENWNEYLKLPNHFKEIVEKTLFEKYPYSTPSIIIKFAIRHNANRLAVTTESDKRNEGKMILNPMVMLTSNREYASQINAAFERFGMKLSTTPASKGMGKSVVFSPVDS